LIVAPASAGSVTARGFRVCFAGAVQAGKMGEKAPFFV
jgi:hypothetical protein